MLALPEWWREWHGGGSIGGGVHSMQCDNGGVVLVLWGRLLRLRPWGKFLKGRAYGDDTGGGGGNALKTRIS